MFHNTNISPLLVAGSGVWLETVDNVITIAASGSGGGSGTPGGSDTQVQFNDGGSFGGDANFTFNKTTNRLTVDYVAVNDDAYDATTWNGNLDVPTKNAVRDKIETLTGLTAEQEDMLELSYLRSLYYLVFKYI